MNICQPNKESTNQSWRSLNEYPIKTKFIFVAGVMVTVHDTVKIVWHKFNLMTRKKITDVDVRTDRWMPGRRRAFFVLKKLSDTQPLYLEGRGFDLPVWQHSLVEIGHEIIL